MELNLDFKKVDVNNPPPFGKDLLLIGVNKEYCVSSMVYTPLVVMGKLDAIKEDDLVFSTRGLISIEAYEYMELTKEQSDVFINMIILQDKKDRL